jgi:hypothetical protein
MFSLDMEKAIIEQKIKAKVEKTQNWGRETIFLPLYLYIAYSLCFQVFLILSLTEPLPVLTEIVNCVVN